MSEKKDDPVIVLDSDTEENDIHIYDENRTQSAGVRSLPTIVVDTQDNDNEYNINDDENNHDDDEITVVRHVTRPDSAHIVDLEQEEHINDGNNGVGDDLVVIGDNTIVGNGNNDNDDSVTFLEERLSPNMVALNLPGGRRIILNANSRERPTRSSFEHLREQRARRLVRASERESRRRQQMRQRRRLGNGIFVAEAEDSDPEGEGEDHLDYDYGRVSGAALDPRYRSSPLSDWATSRAQNASRRRVTRRAAANARIRNSLEHLSGISGQDILNGFLNLGNYPDSMAAYLHSHVYGGQGTPSDDDMEEAQTQSIIDIIQEREESERDQRVKEYNRKTENLQQKFIEDAKFLPPGYSASFATPEVIKDNDNDRDVDDEEIIVCTLCGAELGVGIPDDFTGIKPEDIEMSFDELMEKYDSRCPYQTLGRPSTLDRDLSKRTYVSNCGHLFCGRCFRRYLYARDMKNKSKKSLQLKLGASHPDNFAPKICPADGCKYQVRSKAKMKEVYF
ncbi:E3 ubiquitin-protein ligase complex SLX5-SLX8 subunit SLX5 [Nakaseomyces bracarensis]|uniref:E3 ubiquitin-protein ligase complex SLX5-SLX8 subunit SLX5 n=1 Tax=Nakaseomyces bracarensis TaxID=273131 RepID=A0ABR4NW90_9SACH